MNFPSFLIPICDPSDSFGENGSRLRSSMPRVLDESITVRNYPGALGQVAIKGLGHEKPTLLITNRMEEKLATLVDRYARRMLVENTIEDAINFFHMDVLSSAVLLRIDLDLQLMLIASTLYQALAQHLVSRYQTAKSRTTFNKFVCAPATVITQGDQEMYDSLDAHTILSFVQLAISGPRGRSPRCMAETSLLNTPNPTLPGR